MIFVCPYCIHEGTMKCLIFPYLVLVLIIHSRAYCIPNTTTPDQPLHSNAGEFHGATFILTSNSIVVPRALSLNFGHSTNDDTWPPYYSATSPVNDCGDTEGFHTTGNEGDGPNPVDCASLRDQLDSEPGFWNVTADPGRVDEYILLTSKSTCGLVVKTWANDVDTL